MRELVYYVAVSLDGYIAGPDHQFDAFLIEGDHMEGINEEFAVTIPTDIAARLGIDQSGGRFDTVLMGANTHAVGLPDMPEGEGPQERSQRRGGIAAVEDLAHAAMAQHGHVINAVRTGGHARYQ